MEFVLPNEISCSQWAHALARGNCKASTDLEALVSVASHQAMNSVTALIVVTNSDNHVMGRVYNT